MMCDVPTLKYFVSVVFFSCLDCTHFHRFKRYFELAASELLLNAAVKPHFIFRLFSRYDKLWEKLCFLSTSEAED